jgi:hypothetical protein
MHNKYLIKEAFNTMVAFLESEDSTKSQLIQMEILTEKEDQAEEFMME